MTFLLIMGHLAVGLVVGGFVAQLVFERAQANWSYDDLAAKYRRGDMGWAIAAGLGATLLWPPVLLGLVGFHLLRRFWFGDVLRQLEDEQRQRRIAKQERDLGIDREWRT
jgi:hypothetical protein